VRILARLQGDLLVLYVTSSQHSLITCPTFYSRPFASWLPETALIWLIQFSECVGLNKEPRQFVPAEIFSTQTYCYRNLRGSADFARCNGQTDRLTERLYEEFPVVKRFHVILCSTSHDFICGRWVQAVTYPEVTVEYLQQQTPRTDRVCHDTVSSAQAVSVWLSSAWFCLPGNESPATGSWGRVGLLHWPLWSHAAKGRHTFGRVPSVILTYKLRVSQLSKIQENSNECGQHNSAVRKGCRTGQVRTHCYVQKRARQVTWCGCEYREKGWTPPPRGNITRK
jgi:hypothetical protein